MVQNRKTDLTHVLTGLPSSNVRRRPDENWIDLMDYTDEIIDYLKCTSGDMLERMKQVEQAIDKLPQRERTILTARYIRGLHFNEILKKLPCSERTMYMIHENGLKLLEIPPESQLGSDK